jgi:hypothetical protein
MFVTPALSSGRCIFILFHADPFKDTILEERHGPTLVNPSRQRSLLTRTFQTGKSVPVWRTISTQTTKLEVERKARRVSGGLSCFFAQIMQG